MESEKSVAALALLKPLFALRYSATHRNPYNLVYRLTPAQAYRQGLVKRIEVGSVVEADNFNDVFVRLESITSKKKTLTAKLSVHKQMAKDVVKEKSITVRPGDRLAEKTGRFEYESFLVDEINKSGKFVRFTNGVELREGQAQGISREAIFAQQIRFTIEEHFHKQRRLLPRGLKVVSLFFIDRVDNYMPQDGLIRRLFVQAFDELKIDSRFVADYAAWDAERVQGSYFASERKKGETTFKDTSGDTKADSEAYNLIMKDKERLLSFDEAMCFIFSHSALREGWDNPNVFNICTLNQTTSTMKKRQEIGRGVRLAVNQDGDRVTDEQVNILTVIANESYDNYVRQLQIEYQEEFGAGGAPPPPPNQRKRVAAQLRKAHVLSDDFKNLWERIKHKTRYSVTVDSPALIDACVDELDKTEIRPPQVMTAKAQIGVSEDDQSWVSHESTLAKTAMDLSGKYPVPNLLEVIERNLERSEPQTRITRRTIHTIISRSAKKAAAIANPHEFANALTRIVRRQLAAHLVNGIQYHRTGEWYEMSRIEQDELITSWEQYLVPAERTIYDHVVCMSKPERDFVDGLEKTDGVRLYVKLPNWFRVATPVGEYNPDWAVVFEELDQHTKQPLGKPILYLVSETKSGDYASLRDREKWKVDCGAKHFGDALGVNYKVVTSINEMLP